MPQLSVIIPVYNDEKNLPRCVNSVLSQTFYDFECILVDDGSTDNCPKICDEYAAKDPRVRVFHKKNEGVSVSRQFGITEAKGTYSIHVDSDDWIDPLMFEHIIKKIESDDSDILFMDFFEQNPSGKEYYKQQKIITLEAKLLLHLALKERIFSYIWNILVKQSMYNNYGIAFPQDINYGEDSIIVIELLLNNPKISYLPCAYYHHSFNYNSLTRKNVKGKYYERLKFLDGLKHLFKKYNRTDLDNDSINFFPLNAKYEMLSDGLFSKNEYQSFFKIKNNISYLKYTGIRRFVLLTLAETKFYFLAKVFAQIIRKIKYLR
jgi:glycosyltransferase involved in cell wall biosynthesis